MEKLRVAANQRYFVKEDGKPFIWLADTVWTMPQRMKWDDIEYYMQKRKSQGFTVLQIVALDPERDEQMHTPAGVQALHEGDLTKPNESYFQYLDWIIERAKAYGFYILLLPVWGQLVVGEDWAGGTYEKTVTIENAGCYGEWIGKRYAKQPHIIWCLGGDRQPIHGGIDYRDVWRQMAEGLLRGVTGKTAKYNEDSPYWQELLTTYHSCYERETGECSTMSYWDDADKWIRFIMLQSGHGLDIANYELVRKEYQREQTMPVWDGEPAYEMMPTDWPVVTNFHGSWMVRKRAYWALLSGAFGHTYGHASVWCSISEKEKDQVAQYSWYEALDSEGAGQMKVLRDFLEGIDLHEYEPCRELLVPENGCEQIDRHIAVAIRRDCGGVIAYLPHGGRVRLNIVQIAGERVNGRWFNPSDGKLSDARIARQGDEIEASSPTGGEGCDWVLIIQTDEEISITAKEYGKMTEVTGNSKVFDW